MGEKRAQNLFLSNVSLLTSFCGHIRYPEGQYWMEMVQEGIFILLQCCGKAFVLLSLHTTLAIVLHRCRFSPYQPFHFPNYKINLSWLAFKPKKLSFNQHQRYVCQVLIFILKSKQSSLLTDWDTVTYGSCCFSWWIV